MSTGALLLATVTSLGVHSENCCSHLHPTTQPRGPSHGPRLQVSRLRPTLTDSDRLGHQSAQAWPLRPGAGDAATALAQQLRVTLQAQGLPGARDSARPTSRAGRRQTIVRRVHGARRPPPPPPAEASRAGRRRAALGPISESTPSPPCGRMPPAPPPHARAYNPRRSRSGVDSRF